MRGRGKDPFEWPLLRGASGIRAQEELGILCQMLRELSQGANTGGLRGLVQSLWYIVATTGLTTSTEHPSGRRPCHRNPRLLSGPGTYSLLVNRVCDPMMIRTALLWERQTKRTFMLNQAVCKATACLYYKEPYVHP